MANWAIVDENRPVRPLEPISKKKPFGGSPLTLTLKHMHAWHDKPHALGSWAGPRPRGGPGTQMAQGPGTQGHTKPLTLTLTLKLRALGPRGTPNP